jgi:hypothetical protein
MPASGLKKRLDFTHHCKLGELSKRKNAAEKKHMEA